MSIAGSGSDRPSCSSTFSAQCIQLVRASRDAPVKGLHHATLLCLNPTKYHFYTSKDLSLIATNSDVLILISLQPILVDLYYFKLKWILFDHKIKALHHKFQRYMGLENLGLGKISIPLYRGKFSLNHKLKCLNLNAYIFAI